MNSLGSGFPIDLALPDLWQQEAVRLIKAGHDVIVDAPTGAGKTHIFELLVDGGWRGQAVYTVPTRALANDKRLEWQRKGWNVGIMTGDVAENVEAPVVVATLETQKERLLHADGPSLLVIDEYQMIGDAVRGAAYELSIVLAPTETRLLLLSGSVGNARDVAVWMQKLGRQVTVVSTNIRPVPLEEMPEEQLPRRAPRKVSGFYPRLVSEVLMSGLGPLLIFAPHRQEADKIARQIASTLPAGDPLELTKEQEQILGSQYAGLLSQRVACHHSGMSYQQRAGVIEPLAKAGQLRVVVATMGLAAGINFSMRSVMVTSARFFDGVADREIAPDELLQMFGRAGRRGLDETGYVITTTKSLRLAEANQKYLRRSNQIDWPTLLRVMYWAYLRGEPPTQAAIQLCGALFSMPKIVLGFEHTELVPPPAVVESVAETVRADQNTLFGLRPTRTEILNSRGEWEIRHRDRITAHPLKTAWIHYKNHLDPALEAYHFMNTAFPLGRMCRLHKDGRAIYGKEIAMAMERQPGCFTLTKNIRMLTGFNGTDEYTEPELRESVIPALMPHLFGGAVAGFAKRNEILNLQLDFSETPWPVYEDRYGIPLIEPDERLVALQDTMPSLASLGGNTAAYAWRKLGLIDDQFVPSMRGVVFSFFQGGEGLAIAAALEDESYPLDELVMHLANLRGGSRFASVDTAGSSEMLGAACLQTYGAISYDGYVEAGMPVGYGAGTAEVIEAWLQPSRAKLEIPEHVGTGDIERAFIEWLSLLRQVAGSPELEWSRWMRLRNLCRAEVQSQQKELPTRHLPAVPSIQLAHQPAHHQLLL